VEGIMSLYLARKKASEVELLETRLPLGIMAVRRTLDQLDDRGTALLEAELARPLDPDEDLTAASHRFHNLVAELSGNTVLQVFIPTLCALVGEMLDVPGDRMSATERSETWARVAAAHDLVIVAMLERDVQRASCSSVSTWRR
jgi:DNA-binding GntR family transcriptional regulator